MKKFHMIVDLEKCVGCFNCLMACKDEYVGNRWMPYTEEQQKHEDKWINPTMYERGVAPYTEVCYVTRMCQHCDNPECEKKFPEAFTKRADGLVILDPKKADKKEILGACPYGMIKWNEKLGIAQKCTGCAHLMDDGWKEPRCVQACPVRALQTVFCEDYEWEKLIVNQGLKPLQEGNQPRVLYKNLYRYNKCFVKGALAFDKDGIEQAAVGAHVQLLIGNTIVAETDADFLGEFYIDRIPKDSGKFTMKATYEGYEPITKDFVIEKDSVVLDCLKFGTDEIGKPAVILPNAHADELALQHLPKADAEEVKALHASK